jgi:DUF4097 and DUF4098 domain-containing protein YvlB
MRQVIFASAVLLFAALSIHAQSWSTGPCDEDEGNAHNNWLSGHANRVCELRRAVVPLDGQLSVKGTNGGIEVIGENRTNLAIEARIIADGSSQQEAKSLLQQIKIITTGVIHAEGPQTSVWSRHGWSVNYRLHVPRRLSANLHTVNGGIDLSHLDGVLMVETTNGGLALRDLAGDVHATTVNGGVQLQLSGNRWEGAGLFAQSTNGGISATAPDHYSAHLVAETEHGGIAVDFPITVQGTIKNQINTNLGNGGPTIEVKTVNGGVSIAKD